MKEKLSDSFIKAESDRLDRAFFDAFPLTECDPSFTALDRVKHPELQTIGTVHLEGPDIEVETFPIRKVKRYTCNVLPVIPKVTRKPIQAVRHLERDWQGIHLTSRSLAEVQQWKQNETYLAERKAEREADKAERKAEREAEAADRAQRKAEREADKAKREADHVKAKAERKAALIAERNERNERKAIGKVCRWLSCQPIPPVWTTVDCQPTRLADAIQTQSLLCLSQAERNRLSELWTRNEIQSRLKDGWTGSV